MIDDGYKLLFDSNQVHILENFELPYDVCIAATGSKDKNNNHYFPLQTRMIISMFQKFLKMRLTSISQPLATSIIKAYTSWHIQEKSLDFLLWNLPPTHVRHASLVGNVKKENPKVKQGDQKMDLNFYIQFVQPFLNLKFIWYKTRLDLHWWFHTTFLDLSQEEEWDFG